MNLYPNTSLDALRSSRATQRRARRWSAVVATLVAGGSLLVATPSIATGASAAPHAARAQYPVGIRDAHEPSGVAPPSKTALAGYHLTYETDFTGRHLPAGWGRFAGIPQGDNQSRWLPSHVAVGASMVRLIASRDAALGGKWVTGGVSQYSVGRLYGAYFIRSRVTGPGPDQNEMLWPVAPVWPPEVDFNEMGYPTTSTSWTVHFGHGAAFVQTTRNFNMERWHTWGLIWTPKVMTFTVDGRSWGSLTNYGVIPHQKMMLDMQQQVWCQPRLACPNRASALEVDWVAEYAKN
jgi:hypothetical protein